MTDGKFHPKTYNSVATRQEEQDPNRPGSAGDAYSGWLRRMGNNPRRRSGLHGNLYTLKGYKNWAAKIRRDWKDENG